MTAEAHFALGPAEAGEARCPVCGDGVDGPRTDCPRCETPHHSECWNFNEGCALFGCKAALVAIEAEAEALVRAEGEAPAPSYGWSQRIASLDSTGWKVLGSAVFLVGLLLLGGAMALGEVEVVRRFFRGSMLGVPLKAALVLLPACVAMAGAMVVATAEVVAPFARDLLGGPQRFRLPEETPLKVLEARLGGDPKNPHLLEMVAFHYFADDRYEDAQELYERSLSVNPHQPRIAYQRAKCLERRGLLGAARQAFMALTAGHASKDIQEKAAWFEGVLTRRMERGEPAEPPQEEATGPFEEIEEAGQAAPSAPKKERRQNLPP